MKGLVTSAARRERRAWLPAVAAGVVSAGSAIGLAATSAWLIVRAAERPVVLTLTVPMGLVQLFALFKAASRYVERTATHRAALATMGHVRSGLARRLVGLLPAGLGPRSRDVVEVTLRDVDRIQDFLTAVAGPLATSLVASVIAIAVNGLLLWPTALETSVAIIVVGVIIPAAAARAGVATCARQRELADQFTALVGEMAESDDELLSGHAPALWRATLERLELETDQLRRRDAWTKWLLSFVAAATGGITVAAILLTTSDALVHHFSRTVVAVPALTALAAVELFSGVTLVGLQLASQRESWHRVEALVARTPPVSEPLVAREIPRGPLRADEARVSVRGTGPYSLTLNERGLTMVKGTSGTGKTTLLHLLVKFLVADEGDVQLGGESVVDLDGAQMRHDVGISVETPHVFATSVAGNLRIAKPDASDEELLAVLDAVGLSEFVQSVPEGLATEIGGARARLSGGERRRIGLARELLAPRRFSLIDEPTEGLDDESASTVLEALRGLAEERAVLVVSHRFADYQGADRVVTLTGDGLSLG